MNAANRSLHNFFPTTVQISDIQEAKQLNKKIMKGVAKIKKNVENTQPESWIGDVYTTIGSTINILEQQEFSTLRDIILQEVSSYATSLQFDIKKYPLRINECWINIYDTGDSQEPHNHANSVFSGIYYVKTPNDCAPLILFSPMANSMIEPPTIDSNELNRLSVRYDPKEGQMLIFRSHLMHAVKSSHINEERISIAFNISM